jgi:hypothetical protein
MVVSPEDLARSRQGLLDGREVLARDFNHFITCERFEHHDFINPVAELRCKRRSNSRMILPRTGAALECRDRKPSGLVSLRKCPDTERASHYFNARVANQFDAVLHFDRTRAVEPLERHPIWEAGEMPETFPTGV